MNGSLIAAGNNLITSFINKRFSFKSISNWRLSFSFLTSKISLDCRLKSPEKVEFPAKTAKFLNINLLSSKENC
jgi:hypothetical protein